MQVSKNLIENVGDLRKAFNEISVYDFDVHTSMELYYKIANKFNEVVKELMRFEGVVSDEVIKQNEKLLYLLGEGLYNEVVKKINQMITDGVFESIINHNLFSSLNNKIDEKINIVGTLQTNTLSEYDLIENYKSNVSNNKTNNIFTIATFNVQGFNYKRSFIIKKAMHEIYKTNCNVCCIQEVLHSHEFNIHNLLRTDEFNFNFFKKAIEKDRGEYGIATISNDYILSRSDYNYTVNGNEKRVCQKVEVYFNDKVISIYNTHLSFENEDIIRSQVTELKSFISQDSNKYKIICGDFNTDNISILSELQSLGFTIANTGGYKTYKTKNLAIDNILVTNNMRIKNVYMNVSNDEVSDHNILFAEIEVV